MHSARSLTPYCPSRGKSWAGHGWGHGAGRWRRLGRGGGVGNYLITLSFGLLTTWRTSSEIIRAITMRTGAILVGMAILPIDPATARSLISTTTGGRNIAAGYFSYLRRLESGIRQEHVRGDQPDSAQAAVPQVLVIDHRSILRISRNI